MIEIRGLQVYKATGEHNGRTLYQQKSDANVWLRYSKGGKWMVSPRKEKDANSEQCWMACIDRGLDNPADGRTWEVYCCRDCRKWIKQPQIVVAPEIPGVEVEGVVGTSSTIVNGFYEQHGRLQGRPVLKNQDNTVCPRYSAYNGPSLYRP